MYKFLQKRHQFINHSQLIGHRHLIIDYITKYHLIIGRLLIKAFGLLSLHNNRFQMRFVLTHLIIAILLLSLTAQAPVEDEMHLTITGYVNHKWYSGYLNFSTGAYHYVFFDSQRDPDNDPVVLWLNGGPGCSSIIGMVMENGPFLFRTNKTTFRLNDFAWNQKANVLYLQSPGGVGFSIGYGNNTYNDSTVAQDNYRALTDFFRKFRNLKKNDFYISGESYAGIYIPHLAKKILEMNKLPNTETVMNLKGILIGNPCTHPRECYQRQSEDSMSIYQYEQLYYHNYLTDQQYALITGSCVLSYLSQGCRSIRKKVDAKFDKTMTNINNLYDLCYHQIIGSDEKQNNKKRSRSLSAVQTCQDVKGILKFFNQPLIQVYFHVQQTKYQLCSAQIDEKYTMFEKGSINLYPQLMKSGMRIWIFSGDIDANVPITGTLRWIQLLKDIEGIPVVQPWREWWAPGLHKHEDQMAGMVWKLRGLTFVSVKGAGHMVPKDKPKQAQVMFQAFISGKDLPEKSL